jgi:organic hydroperoxide reductase OsmC/OhrA
VDSYFDKAEGVMAKNSDGKLVVTKVTLRPLVKFSGEKVPTRDQLDALHHEAHEECFLANSVKSEIVCEPQL